MVNAKYERIFTEIIFRGTKQYRTPEDGHLFYAHHWVIFIIIWVSENPSIANLRGKRTLLDKPTLYLLLTL